MRTVALVLGFYLYIGLLHGIVLHPVGIRDALTLIIAWLPGTFSGRVRDWCLRR